MINRNDFLDNFGTTIENERTALRYSQTEMANALDMSLSSYKRIVNGESHKIDLYTIYRLQELTGKSCDELCQTSLPYVEIYNLMRQLSEPQLHFVRGVIDFEIAFSRELQASSSEKDYITMIIPSGNMQDGMIYDSCSLRKLNIAPYRKRYGNQIDSAVMVTSNHLQPVYHQNDILLLSRDSIRDGDTGLFLNTSTGLAYIRKFRETEPNRLEPVNNYGQIFYLDNNDPDEISKWIKFSYVVTKMRT
jgi:transcriptional regulator with XRE-family HTH domain